MVYICEVNEFFYLVGVIGFVIRDDVGHEGTVFDVFIITHDMDGVLARFSGPVLHITRAVILIFTLNPGLRRTLDGEAYSNKVFRSQAGDS